eukprot:SAG31_NODE_939_length_10873_cov_5.403843_3_plen_675_part_00
MLNVSHPISNGTKEAGDIDSELASAIARGRLVNYDLDCNVAYAVTAIEQKLAMAAEPSLSMALLHLLASKASGTAPMPPPTKLHSAARIAGQIFVPLHTFMHRSFELQPQDALHSTMGWWCADGEAGLKKLAALRAKHGHANGSRWAIVEPRQLLGPNRCVNLPVGQLHFTRDHATGKPMYVEAPGSTWCTVTPPRAPLHKGCKGAAVQALQFLLVQASLMKPEAIRFHAGMYGKNTESAVAALQLTAGLLPTGRYDVDAEQALSARMQSTDKSAAGEKLGAAATVAAVEGCLGMLIPHAPVLSLQELIQRVSIRHRAFDWSDPAKLAAAKSTLSAFAAGTGDDHGQPFSHVALPGLSELDRGVIHDATEAIGIGHVSIGPTGDRTLLLWRKNASGATKPMQAISRFTMSGHADTGCASDGSSIPTLFSAGSAEPEPEPEGEIVAGQRWWDRNSSVLLNQRGREVVGNPVPIIELAGDPPVEVSRGFVLPPGWPAAAAKLQSKGGEPKANSHQSKQYKAFWGAATTTKFDASDWELVRPKGKRAPAKDQRWANLSFAHLRREGDVSTIDGLGCLQVLKRWVVDSGLTTSDSKLHGATAKAMVAAAFAATTDSSALLLGLLAATFAERLADAVIAVRFGMLCFSERVLIHSAFILDHRQKMTRRNWRTSWWEHWR